MKSKRSTQLSAQDVASYFINFCHNHGDYITNLKLQKLLYYAQAWYLALYNKPLFGEEIQAWVHGPVIPSVYSSYKKHSYKPIDENPSISLPSDISKHLEEVMEVYGGCSAFDLERMTHQSEPWIKARGGIPIDQSSNDIISQKDMKNYYARMVKDNGKDKR
jgi:uncharacterized phage-associated protein